MRYKVNITKKHLPDASLVIILIIISSVLVFYKLGQSSLISFDEAWYADISKNIITNGNFLNLVSNGQKYTDHPFLGFLLTAIFFKIFGVSEFWARFPQAVSGIFSVVVLFYLGRELFNKWVGFTSALALTSTIWFIYRARSGNLDILLTLMFLLTIFLAIKAAKNTQYLIIFFVSLLLLFLSKTMVPLTIIPVLIVIFYKSKVRTKDFLFGFGLFIFGFGSWMLSQHFYKANFLYDYLNIGLPGVSSETAYLYNFKTFKSYLHEGIGRWFWPSILALFLSQLFWQKRFLILGIFSLSFSLPFLFSHRGNIWHLIPLYPFMLLAFFGFIDVLLGKLTKTTLVGLLGIFLIGGYFYSTQILNVWRQVIAIPAYVSDEAILSMEAAKYSQKYFIDGDFVPVANFYSGKQVFRLYEGEIKEIFSKSADFIMFTKLSRLDEAGISSNSYKILKSDRDKILVIPN